MEAEKIKKVLEELKKEKRKFVQKYDLIINLKDIDVKNNKVDFFVALHYPKGKKISVCALVGRELAEKAKDVCNEVINEKDFAAYKDDLKKIKVLAKKHDYFIAQANLMPRVASIFGRALGVRGKMPNPKVGCVVPPNADLKILVERLQKTVRLWTKSSPIVHCMVGNEEMKDEEIIDNITTIYNQLVHHLPKEKHNIKNVFIKKTMSKPVKI